VQGQSPCKKNSPRQRRAEARLKYSLTKNKMKNSMDENPEIIVFQVLLFLSKYKEY